MPLLLATALLLIPGNPALTAPSKRVTILGSITGEGAETITQVFEPFTAATGIEVVYEGTDAFATLLPVRLEGGDAPDVALFPQPGLMADLARENQLVPLDRFLSRDRLTAAYPPYWIDLGTVDGKVYGLWARADLKSLVWYSPPAFAAAGYTVPTTWTDLTALSDRIIADGGVPWCLGLESGAASGWVGTDWVEELLLRTAGPQVYDHWVTHQIPFDAPEVKRAFELFGRLVFEPKSVLGGAVGALSTPFGDAPSGLFTDPPTCYLHRQASFISTFFPPSVQLDKTASLFQFPGIDPKFGTPLGVSGTVFGLLNDTPSARAVMEYLLSPTPHRLWAQAEGYVSPHLQVKQDAYPTEVSRLQADMLAQSEVVRFDGSDLMPGAVGTGSFWTGVMDYVGGENLDDVLAEIEASWPTE